MLRKYLQNRKAKKELNLQVDAVKKAILKGEKHHLENFRTNSFGYVIANFSFNNKDYSVTTKSFIDILGSSALFEISVWANSQHILIGKYDSNIHNEIVWDKHFPNIVDEAKHIFANFSKIVDSKINENIEELRKVLV